MAFKDLDARGPPQNGCEEWRVVDVWIPGKRRIERQKPGDFIAGRGSGHEDVAHCGAVVERLDREESGHLLPVLVHVFLVSML